MFEWLKTGTKDTTGIVNRAFDKAVEKTGAVVESEKAQHLKTSTVSAMTAAGEIAKNMSDINEDGKFDSEDVRLAAEKAGIAWVGLDPDLRKALIAGGVAGVGVNIVPILGQAIAIPTFVGTTAYFYLVAKLGEHKKL